MEQWQDNVTNDSGQLGVHSTNGDYKRIKAIFWWHVD